MIHRNVMSLIVSSVLLLMLLLSITSMGWSVSATTATHVSLQHQQQPQHHHQRQHHSHHQLVRRQVMTAECNQTAEKVGKCFQKRWRLMYNQWESETVNPNGCCFILEVHCAFKPWIKQCLNSTAEDQYNKEMKKCSDNGFTANDANCMALNPNESVDKCKEFSQCFLVRPISSSSATLGLPLLLISVIDVIVIIVVVISSSVTVY
ncbi:uncharacterized protein LOC128954618 [Oppia nitens]|uniref:uncharacterized protein LOC128954618 n=1 Tax=Oppia nitens TaxID=1686743 RepID=UPI0023DAD764|nr:uncharacterized protein LOC128954618 [Oppia nitens]